MRKCLKNLEAELNYRDMSLGTLVVDKICRDRICRDIQSLKEIIKNENGFFSYIVTLII